jgi:hypothetical protein
VGNIAPDAPFRKPLDGAQYPAELGEVALFVRSLITGSSSRLITLDVKK